MTAQTLQATTAEAIAAMLAIANSLQQQTNLIVAEKSEPYVGADQLIEALGETAFSRRKIFEDLRAGYFKLGRDYANISHGDKPNYVFKVSKIRAVYETAPEKRKIYPR